MRRIFYDTEFIDDGNTIELISIGMVADNGNEYYAVNLDLTVSRLADDTWHLENTVPSLPLRLRETGELDWVLDHPDRDRIKSKALIRDEVHDFIWHNSDHFSTNVSDNVELWAWYGAYDHVVLAQLWGPMHKLPYSIVPMNTCDFKQELERVIQATGNKRLRFDLPKMESGTVHNALDDARLLKTRFEWLKSLSET